MARASEKLSEEQLAELMAPIVVERPVEIEPAKMKVPPPALPESDAAALERLRSAGLVREEGTGDPPPFVVPTQRLTITERDGRATEIELVPDYGAAYLMIEYPTPRRDEPWVMEQNAARVGIASIKSLVLVDVEPG